MMKKNKFIINKIGKLSTLIPAFSMLVALKGYALGLPKYSIKPGNEISQSISFNQETLDYKTESAKFSEVEALNNLFNILTSNLMQLNSKSLSEDQVQNEISAYIKTMNTNTYQLACLYKAMEVNTLKESNLTDEEIDQNFDKLAIRIDVQHYLHNMLDNLNLIRLGVNQNEYQNICNTNNKQSCSFLYCNTTSENDIRKDSENLLNSFKNSLSSFIYFGNENEKEFANHLIVSFVQGDFQEIDFLISQPNFNKNNCNNLSNVINTLAEVLPDMFGNESMRRSLVINYASQFAFNNLLYHLEKLGYQLNDFIIKNPGQKEVVAITK